MVLAACQRRTDSIVLEAPGERMESTIPCASPRELKQGIKMHALCEMNTKPHSQMRFACELLAHSADDTDGELNLGGGLRLKDLLSHIDATGCELGITGIYIHFGAKGAVSFRAQHNAGRNTKVRTASFSITKHGIRQAFAKAVQARAEMVGYSGTIPDIQAPDKETIIQICLARKGADWLDRHATRAMLDDKG